MKSEISKIAELVGYIAICIVGYFAVPVAVLIIDVYKTRQRNK